MDTSYAQKFNLSEAVEDSYQTTVDTEMVPFMFPNLHPFIDPLSVYYTLPLSGPFSFSAGDSIEEDPLQILSDQLVYSPNSINPSTSSGFSFPSNPSNTSSISNYETSLVQNQKINAVSQAAPCLYSNSGFDIISLLAKVITRPNPQINIGPIDLSCACLVVDASLFDLPIVYASGSFENLTGYNTSEIIGRNCRFLQSPDGQVTLGSKRQYTDNDIAHQFKTNIIHAKESQASMINYKKNGQPFINLITIIPVCFDETITYYVGFQVDLTENPNSVMSKTKDGNYAINYCNLTIPASITIPYEISETNDVPKIESSETTIEKSSSLEENKSDWYQTLIENSDDFVYVLTLKGVFLYAAPTSLKLFGYSNDSLMDQHISDICHPDDLVPLIREIKDSAISNQSVSLNFRIRCSNGKYIWLESTGKTHSDLVKGRRFIVLSGRSRSESFISRNSILNAGDFQENEFWCKLSFEGLFLYLTNSCSNSLGFTSEELFGTSLYQLIQPDYKSMLSQAIQQARDGEIAELFLELQGKIHCIYVNLYFYPGSSGSGFIYCRSRPCGFLNNTAVLNNSSDPFSLSSSPVNSSVSDSSFNDNWLAFSNPESTNTWQYEFHQLQATNNKLRQEIEAYLQPSVKSVNKGKRRRSNLTNLICLSCHKTESSEWRRGPQGPKTLCNPCGIKYAKKIQTLSYKTQSRPNSSQVKRGSNTSSTQGSDNEHSLYLPRHGKIVRVL